MKSQKNNVPSHSETIHKLNNLLTGINLYMELLLQKSSGPLNSKQKTYLKTILSETKKIKTLVKKLSKD